MRGGGAALRLILIGGTALAIVNPASVAAQRQARRASTQAQLDRAMGLIRVQGARIDAQAAEIADLRAKMDGTAQQIATLSVPTPLPSLASAAPSPLNAAQGAAPGSPGSAGALQAPLERVGQAPEDENRPIELAVLDNTGSVVTRRGQLTAEFQADYARADRNRAIFRGVGLLETVLVGVFDINESRQDVLTASGSLRYGLTDRLELGVRVPFVHRSDSSIVAPIMNSTTDDNAATVDLSAKGTNIGDVEVTARYQLIDGHPGTPYVIANLQGVFPTGTDPFDITRDSTGRPSSAATGSGFYGITPSFTAILPSDPVVLFGTVGYTFNFGKDTHTRIPPIIITHVEPGDAISASAGIGVSFNQRTTLNLGYAHSWAFGTKTQTRLIMPTAAWPGHRTLQSRDLQIGRLLFGVTYRATERASVNWSVEVGATDDATDLRTSLRIPFVLLTGG